MRSVSVPDHLANNACGNRTSTCLQDIDHFLLTRFAVPAPSGTNPSHAWIADRFPLFEKFCFPSVMAQDCRHFTWGLLVSPDFPDWAYQRLLCLGLPASSIITTEDWRGDKAAKEWIHSEAGSKWILTSRLDNDDAIASNFASRLHRLTWHQERIALNFNYGLQLTRHGLLLTRHSSNPFISVMERSGSQLRTVLAYDHDEVHHHFPTKKIRGAPGWLQTIHENNLANIPRGIPVKRPYGSRLFPGIEAMPWYGLANYWRDTRPDTAITRRLRRTFRSS